MPKRVCRVLPEGATPIVVDIKGMFDPETATKQGVRYWRL